MAMASAVLVKPYLHHLDSMHIPRAGQGARLRNQEALPTHSGIKSSLPHHPLRYPSAEKRKLRNTELVTEYGILE